ncbi:uncharacterized protein LOC129577054 isoform X2 [Sitodiplosis mosellana]|uniref:uncharacterized protein LOC129577054 isoform X2 n=1 Tax=Sitodiplosis mosellana TaxID=263140 RepID=UPI002443C163|nr:uncharacterized protein LOC129577054 isoform X2 [Sitodiplosis mosellana]XP_055319454.1 uncharacterized protein LOC129577054 isoform X2 [Sitodiplosis mosellana]XP_055319455.1 uncharacterized protein LOC129577054 isoform X2 [Sitodiplosis mosellana]XP_055319457.1 uncharacterized protein LOC129577054 isoform X2 [Sitodiplosis mosellana]XP_055319458.1 uncharacterized protein LOC129577054 isoform X2 [Sitodiplosis mosellana]XP_055319459.1 uncharacterized protein LOC129577054 isoform X2 [Sitodiplosi
MDCDSDESERWEDFFGSSTDISPSVIAYYDRLSSSSTDHTNSLKSLSHSKSSLLIDTNTSYNNNPLLDFDRVTSRTRVANVEETLIKSLKPTPPPLPKLPPPSIHRRHRNFRALSANVQRLISHSNTSLHPDDMNENHLADDDSSNLNCVRKRFLASQITVPTTVVTNGSSKFKHPLSKNTCKLTQSGGNDLVIDGDSDGGYVTPPEIPYANIDHVYDIVNANVNSDDPDEDTVDKTPINECPPFDFNHEINSNILDDDVYDEVVKEEANENEEAEAEHKNAWESSENNDTAAVATADDPLISLKNTSFIHSIANKCEHVPANDSSQSGSAQNSPTLSQKSTASHDSQTTKSTTATPTKSQLFAIKAQVIEQSTKKHSPISSSSSGNDTTTLANAVESDPLPATYNNNNEATAVPVPAATPPTTTAVNHKENAQFTIDLKRTKIRPLSSVSISSTSSSSSSASDEHSSNQNAISYLASVESLADHSENELAITSPSLTVTERACLEIIDSERNYVDDLGQVIRGYLNDWQERGHLEAQELNTLFGNIQEVYDFNVILLRELEQSGTEPNKIAKSFIKLQDKFDAYTQYCTSYPDAISLLTTLLQASHTNALLATTQKSLQHTLPLGSYLLKPVQRILKYHLLLDNLRKHCDVVEVLQAHDIMRNVAQHIDQVKRNLEQQSRVRELSGILDGWLGPELTVLGDLVLEGMLTENGKPRTVLLFERMLIITKKKEDNRLQLKTYINCKSLMLIEHLPGDPESFSVIPYNDLHPNQIKLTARNRDQKRKWAQHIKQVMLAHFDIPNRAKELLFQLGEEDDRSTDKNTWRWNHNSSTTPEYLERRNQYRRSEMRYRSKKSRKIFNASLSMVEDQFDQPITNADNGKNKQLDSMIKELQQRNSLIKQNDDTVSIMSGTTQATDLESRTDDNDDLSICNDYEIPFDANKALPCKPASALDKAKSKLLEVRIYNTKTLPKRIANLKKQRSKTLKETSKFYMDLPEENTDTVLKITETSDDLSIGDGRVNRRRASLDATDTISKNLDDSNRKLSSVSLLTPSNLIQKHAINKSKRDIDIISELLKDHKEFDRILKKPPKKLSESEKSSPNHELRNSKFAKGELFFKLPLPPIPVEANEFSRSENFIQRDLPPEPIYESLLRNVHVPYKFPSPVLNRSLSQPNSRFLKVKRPTEAPPKRPDSDYVTLTFDENGEMTSIDDEVRLPKHGSHFRKSDTNINYHVRKMSDEKVPSFESFSSFIEGSRRSTSSETDYSNVSISSIQTTKSSDLLSPQNTSHDASTFNGTEVYKSVDHLNFGKPSNKLPERRVSDVTGMHRKSIIHKQGSKALGSRIASVDYADPKILFANNNSYLSLTSKPFIQSLANLQRDSAFSLTSSNDSVNIAASQDIPKTPTVEPQQVTVIYTNQQVKNDTIDVPTLNVCKASSSSHSSSSSSGDDSYYEKTVESYLENDGIFRDSAIYSDDNTEKPYSRPEHIYSTIDEVKQEEKVKPAIPPKLNLAKVQNASVITRSAPPPPLPAKPLFAPPALPAKVGKRCEQTLEKLMATPLPPPPSTENTNPFRKSDTPSTNSNSSDSDTVKTQSIITMKQKSMEEQEKRLSEKSIQITPPPIPARNFSNKNASWVMKQIQNLELQNFEK